jgi:hypothetical protein
MGATERRIRLATTLTVVVPVVRGHVHQDVQSMAGEDEPDGGTSTVSANAVDRLAPGGEDHFP